MAKQATKSGARKPRYTRGDSFTHTGTPTLGFLNNFSCPRCGDHLFSYYDGDMQHANYKFRVRTEWNYCSVCGQPLDLDQWKEDPEDDLMLED